MDQPLVLVQIKKHFSNLKQCHDWCLKSFPSALGLEGAYTEEDKIKLHDKILPAVEKEYDYLAELGVSKTFSACLFIFGSLITQNLVRQFES